MNKHNETLNKLAIRIDNVSIAIDKLDDMDFNYSALDTAVAYLNKARELVESCK